ncbi:MAG: DUF111 family protein, partial [Campylobacter sp.]|nr:DUF111 family protein [Campylobacter sp.]
YMKKGRIGFELSVLCKNEEADKFRELIFANTSAIGVREYEIKKTELKRKFVKVVTKFGEISVKISGDGKNLTVKPEFSECMAFANKFGVTLATVRSEAIKAYENAKFKE